MSLSRLCGMIGFVSLIIGGITFILPGEFLYYGTIQGVITSYGSLLFPALATNPALAMGIRKLPSLAFIFLGLILLVISVIRGTKESPALKK